MHHLMPHFRYRFITVFNKRVPCIEIDGKIIHEIHNLDEFYDMFGYTPANSKGMLPDEFIWSQYVNNSVADFSPCVQMHIAEYLRRHCELFNEKYGDQWDAWVAAHAASREKRGVLCPGCSLRQSRNRSGEPVLERQ